MGGAALMPICCHACTSRTLHTFLTAAPACCCCTFLSATSASTFPGDSLWVGVQGAAAVGRQARQKRRTPKHGQAGKEKYLEEEDLGSGQEGRRKGRTAPLHSASWAYAAHLSAHCSAARVRKRPSTRATLPPAAFSLFCCLPAYRSAHHAASRKAGVDKPLPSALPVRAHFSPAGIWTSLLALAAPLRSCSATSRRGAARARCRCATPGGACRIAARHPTLRTNVSYQACPYRSANMRSAPAALRAPLRALFAVPLHAARMHACAARAHCLAQHFADAPGTSVARWRNGGGEAMPLAGEISRFPSAFLSLLSALPCLSSVPCSSTLLLTCIVFAYGYASQATYVKILHGQTVWTGRRLPASPNTHHCLLSTAQLLPL